MDILFYFLVFIFGTFIGSFLGVVIDRLPRGESIVKGRSHCDHCKKSLATFDLIPVFSFLFLRGRCRYCKTKLSSFYPLIEIVTGALFVLTALQLSNMYEVLGMEYMIAALYYLFIISVLIVIFFIDLKHGIIPFPVIVPAIIVSFFYLLFFENSLFVNHLLAGVGACLFFLAVFLATRGRGMGFGDVIYAFFMGLVLGFPHIVVGLYIAFVSGALISLVLLGLKLKKLKGGIIPFGPFLVLGTLIALFWGQIFIDYIMVYLTN
jgi:leader peptidase (prepilin peptidase) / N-methyltransferase